MLKFIEFDEPNEVRKDDGQSLTKTPDIANPIKDAVDVSFNRVKI